MTDHLGQSQVLPYLCGLAEKGCEITLISFEKDEVFLKKKADITAISKEANIEWIPLKYHKSPAVFSTLYDVVQGRKLASKIVKEKGIQVVHCRSYIAGLIGLHLKKKNQIRFLFDIRGFWVDERIDGRIWDLNNALIKRVYKFFRKKEKSMFQAADAVVTLTHASVDIIKNKFGAKGHIQVIPCAVDKEVFETKHLKKENRIRSEIDWQNNFILLYLGSLGTWYLLEEMLMFFKALKNKKPDAKFLFLTGEAPNVVYSKAEELGIDPNDIKVLKADRRELRYYLAEVDLSVFFIKDCFSKQASSPTKHGELLAAGVPTICNDIGDLKRINAEFEYGMVLKELNDDSYETAIDALPMVIKEESYSSAVQKYYSLTDGIKSYYSLYSSLLE